MSTVKTITNVEMKDQTKEVNHNDENQTNVSHTEKNENDKNQSAYKGETNEIQTNEN